MVQQMTVNSGLLDLLMTIALWNTLLNIEISCIFCCCVFVCLLSVNIHEADIIRQNKNNRNVVAGEMKIEINANSNGPMMDAPSSMACMPLFNEGSCSFSTISGK